MVMMSMLRSSGVGDVRVVVRRRERERERRGDRMLICILVSWKMCEASDLKARWEE
tara:strand:+ start:1520 stop:1687 length:168 start_codon:yes stop_codon:yes gene_type:complete